MRAIEAYNMVVNYFKARDLPEQDACVRRALERSENQRRELRRLNNVIKQQRHDLDAAHRRNVQLVNQLIHQAQQEKIAS